MLLQQVRLREASQHLSHYIDEVEQGTEIIITRRGQPVARLLTIAKKRKLTHTQQKTWDNLLNKLRKGYFLGEEKLNLERAHER